MAQSHLQNPPFFCTLSPHPFHLFPAGDFAAVGTNPDQITTKREESKLFSVGCPLAFLRSLSLSLMALRNKLVLRMDFLCCGKFVDWTRERRKKEKTSWRVFSLKELHSATNNFNYDNKLGEGGFGSVYWGQLWDGSQIAVKRLKAWSNKAEMEFAVEVEVLARVRHKNLLSLRGYCAEGQERLIVYDFMPNLSLLSHLHGQHSSECLLDWGRRMNIAIGSAEGIAYLHHNASPHIIHRDIKASNVLLDSEFQARVADFGFAKLIPDGATHVTTRVKGTLGYLAPEYAMFGKASESCDVYSFGILLLELASGKKPIEKVSSTVKRTVMDWALPLAKERRFKEMADPKLNGKFVEDELQRMVIVALICAQSRPEKRLTMVEIVALLKGELKEKMAELENDEMFGNYQGFTAAAAADSSDCISEEKDAKGDVKRRCENAVVNIEQ